MKLWQPSGHGQAAAAVGHACHAMEWMNYCWAEPEGVKLLEVYPVLRCGHGRKGKAKAVALELLLAAPLYAHALTE